MATSRLRRFEERRLKKRILLTVAGSIAILLLFTVFGLKLLEGFSLFLDRMRGQAAPTKPAQTFVVPPVLDPLPEATASTALTLNGKGQPGLWLLLYVNEAETRKLKIPDNGNFSVASLALIEGGNVISAKAADDSGNTSDLSNVITVLVKRTPPALDIVSPPDNATVFGDKNSVAIQGTVKDDGTTVTINGRFVVVSANGSFLYDAPLNEGANTVTIVATDAAGNQTTIERHVTYTR